MHLCLGFTYSSVSSPMVMFYFKHFSLASSLAVMQVHRLIADKIHICSCPIALLCLVPPPIRCLWDSRAFSTHALIVAEPEGKQIK